MKHKTEAIGLNTQQRSWQAVAATAIDTIVMHSYMTDR